MKDVRLRAATSDDYDFLYRLHRSTFREPVAEIWGWQEERQKRRFREQFDPDRRQIIEVGGEDVGAFCFEDKGDHVFLEYIALIPEYQRRGIGSRLIESVIDEGRKCGKPVRLQVLRTNKAAISLYERLDFVVTQETETHFVMRHPAGQREGSTDEAATS